MCAQEKFVFPVEMCVTKLSGMGTDCIFLAVLRPMPVSLHNVRAWVAPSGVILCTDQQFSSLVGVTGALGICLVGWLISALS